MQRPVKKERIFVNSYTMKESGDDVQFKVDLGRIHSNVFKIELQQIAIENKFLNFYDSFRGNFRDLSFSYNFTTYSITIDQYINMDNLSSLILNKTGINFNIQFTNGTIYADPTSRLRLTNPTGNSIIFTGFGWSKLGFELGKVFTFANNRLDASFLADFG